MDNPILDLFALRGRLISKDVSPWQTFSGKGMEFHLESYDWDYCACVSFLSMRGFFGLMKMETLICTPYAQDIPLFSYDRIHAFGNQSLLLELYNTQSKPINLSSLDAVKSSYKDLRNKKVKSGWYDGLRLSPSTFKQGSENHLSQLGRDMATAYLDLFSNLHDVDISVKKGITRAYVEGLISNGGPAINTIRGMLGDEATETLFRRFIFGTE